MSKFKAKRPDPVKLLERIHHLQARVQAAGEVLSQVAEENKEFNVRCDANYKVWNTEARERHAAHESARQDFAGARDKLQDVTHEVMGLLIEDMKN